jgi:hypothetical protein
MSVTTAATAAECELQMPMKLPYRLDAILALETAIESYQGYTGPEPGKWIVDMLGRFFIALT